MISTVSVFNGVLYPNLYSEYSYLFWIITKLIALNDNSNVFTVIFSITEYFPVPIPLYDKILHIVSKVLLIFCIIFAIQPNVMKYVNSKEPCSLSRKIVESGSVYNGWGGGGGGTGYILFLHVV